MIPETKDVILDQIDPNPWQPRAQLNPARVAELADDIAQNGLLQRPLVRADGNGRYQIVFGHYRIAALRLLAEQARLVTYELIGTGRYLIPLDVRNLSDAEVALIALAENTEREDLTPIEQYRAWQHALDTIPGLEIQHLADSLGLGRSTVSNHLRLLRLPPVVLDRVESGELSAHAAREFLCLMSPGGHYHEDDMTAVIDTIAGRGGYSGAPDWRVKHVRECIRHQVVISNESGWRPLEDKQQDHWDGEGGGANREPTFDVGVFRQDHPNELHSIPRHGGDAARLWTCNVREWQRRQTQATRAQNQAQAATAPATTPSAATKAPKSADLTRTLARDALVQAVTRPAGVSQETRTTAQIARAVANLDPALKTALGSRANAQVIDPKVFHALLENAEHYQARKRAPSYFDRDECLNQCTNGACYGHFQASQPLALYCLNEAHYDQVLATSQQGTRQRLLDVIAGDDAEDRALVEAVRARLDPSLSLPLATVLVVDQPHHASPTLDDLPYGEQREFQEARSTTKRIAELTGVDLAEHTWGPREIQKAQALIDQLAAASDEVKLEVATLLLVYNTRHSINNGVPYLLGLLRGEAVTLQMVEQDPDDEEQDGNEDEEPQDDESEQGGVGEEDDFD